MSQVPATSGNTKVPTSIIHIPNSRRHSHIWIVWSLTGRMRFFSGISNQQARQVYPQLAKTTQFRGGGTGWFRACWDISQTLGTQKNFLRLRDSLESLKPLRCQWRTSIQGLRQCIPCLCYSRHLMPGGFASLHFRTRILLALSGSYTVSFRVGFTLL